MNTPERVDNRAYCACLRVEYAPRHNDDGSATERWACPLCGGEFVRRFWHDRMEQRALNAERERDEANKELLLLHAQYRQVSNLEALRVREIAALRAERDTLRADLLALAGYADAHLSHMEHELAVEGTPPSPAMAAARLILARVATEGAS